MMYGFAFPPSALHVNATVQRIFSPGVERASTVFSPFVAHVKASVMEKLSGVCRPQPQQRPDAATHAGRTDVRHNEIAQTHADPSPHLIHVVDSSGLDASLTRQKQAFLSKRRQQLFEIDGQLLAHVGPAPSTHGNHVSVQLMSAATKEDAHVARQEKPARYIIRLMTMI